jgi:hypothetical protein
VTVPDFAAEDARTKPAGKLKRRKSGIAFSEAQAQQKRL